tara:strand:- start:92 stop:763 length:672 start_codon:yes stop_codon:yes gene_type:complete
MRVAISGTSNIGKQEFLKTFLKEFPSYTTPETNYKTVIDAIYKKAVEEKRETSSKDIQWNILNYMIDTMQEYDRDDKVVFDGCTLDNAIYSLYLMEKSPKISKIDSNFIDTCVPIIRESMKYLDIVFWLPITKADKTDRKFEEEDKEVNHLYAAMHNHYLEGKSPFLPKDDQPAIIEVFGNKEQRLQMVKLYLDEEGEVIFDKSMSDIIDPEMVELQEQISKD